jgi:hypothetical protein
MAKQQHMGWYVESAPGHTFRQGTASQLASQCASRARHSHQYQPSLLLVLLLALVLLA